MSDDEDRRARDRHRSDRRCVYGCMYSSIFSLINSTENRIHRDDDHAPALDPGTLFAAVVVLIILIAGRLLPSAHERKRHRCRRCTIRSLHSRLLNGSDSSQAREFMHM